QQRHGIHADLKTVVVEEHVAQPTALGIPAPSERRIDWYAPGWSVERALRRYHLYRIRLDLLALGLPSLRGCIPGRGGDGLTCTSRKQNHETQTQTQADDSSIHDVASN